ncbi:hypothetical protein UFOVP1158_44 [uncultured Caudovirales phage]|uniref:Uncharacterized protein n=1 Tax=uncultured Caudovirales phage TaxID=2100421 RepID=A0A6J5QSM4_9CAUD|nr:hypothetical protein UFOVP1158_44 [uncultured Caudovirales phage]
MSDDNVQVILFRLEHMEKTLAAIHAEVKRTNGRVTELEMVNAAYNGELKAKYAQRLILTTVLSGAILAGVIWFIQAAI